MRTQAYMVSKTGEVLAQMGGLEDVSEFVRSGSATPEQLASLTVMASSPEEARQIVIKTQEQNLQ